jgi:hypothetical protein
MTKDVKHTVLPSGRTVSIRAGKGRDLMRAHRVAAGNPEPLAVSFALVAELAEIDGKSIVFEDILEMDLEDVLALQDEVLGRETNDTNFFSRTKATPSTADSRDRKHSQSSSGSDSHTRS